MTSTAQKYSRLLIASKITIDEYAQNLLNSCVGEPEIDGTVVHAVAVTVPDVARKRLDQEIAKILDSTYRYPELHFGGPGRVPRFARKCVAFMKPEFGPSLQR